MKADKLVSHTIKDSEGKERPKTFHDYTGEEIDQMWDEDPERVDKLWSDAEIEAMNDPANRDKAK
jgi:hypothetical protein